MPKRTVPARGGASPASGLTPTRRKHTKRRGGDLFLHPDAHRFLGNPGGDLDAKIAALPFVGERKGKGTPRCFWVATATGDYSADYNQGRQWAALVMPFLKYNIGPVLLSWIVADMISAGEKNGLVLGFIREIGALLGESRAGLLIAVACTGADTPKYMQSFWRKARPIVVGGVRDAM